MTQTLTSLCANYSPTIPKVNFLVLTRIRYAWNILLLSYQHYNW